MIGGETPLWGLSEATARCRQLHETELGQCTIGVFPVRACGMEVGSEPQHRAKVNPYVGSSGLGKRALQRDARYPIVTKEY